MTHLANMWRLCYSIINFKSPNCKKLEVLETTKRNYIFSMFTWEAISDEYAKDLIGNVSKITYDYFMNGGKYFENY